VCSSDLAGLHGERIPHTFISDPSYDLASRKKHLLIDSHDNNVTNSAG
jgi:hypothetical protein